MKAQIIWITKEKHTLIKRKTITGFSSGHSCWLLGVYYTAGFQWRVPENTLPVVCDSFDSFFRWLHRHLQYILHTLVQLFGTAITNQIHCWCTKWLSSKISSSKHWPITTYFWCCLDLQDAIIFLLKEGPGLEEDKLSQFVAFRR